MGTEKKERFATWKVGGTIHKMKLTTEKNVELEEQFGENLIVTVMKNKMPKLRDMLAITWKGLQAYEPELELQGVYDLFDEYIDTDGTQTDFMSGPFMSLLQVSGFFTKKQKDQAEQLQESKPVKMEEAGAAEA